MIRIVTALLFFAGFLCLITPRAQGSEHAGPTLRVRAAGVTAGAAVLLEPVGGPRPDLANAGATVAAVPVGSSAGPTLEVAGGPWPILAIAPVDPLPEPGGLAALFASAALVAGLARRRSALASRARASC